MLTSAGREWLKWIALVAMTIDHANKVLGLDLHWMFVVGRLPWPLFAVVLVDNLSSHPDPFAWRRAAWRLLWAGLLVQPLYYYAFGLHAPLNVLLAFSLGLYLCTETRWLPSLAALAIGGLFVEMMWFGGFLFLVACAWSKSGGSWRGWLALSVGVASLSVVNGNAWAMAALPTIWLAQYVPGRVPRWRWLFLGYYFAHLLALAGLARYLLPAVL